MVPKAATGAVAAVVLAAAGPAVAAVNISAAPTKNFSCSAGVCAPTAKAAVLNSGELQTMLAASDVTVGTGAGAVTIEITAPLAWASAHRLTLNADHNVSIKAPVAVEGAGGLTVNDNRSASDGDLRFFPGGKIDFWDVSSSLVINGVTHVLVNDLATLASAVAANPSNGVALARDYDAGPDGIYINAAVTANFEGDFEGLGHTVSNFRAQRGSSPYTGLFGRVGAVFGSATLRDLTLTNAYIFAGTSGVAGILVGAINGKVVGVKVDGKVDADVASHVGGLLGDSNGLIVRSSSSADVAAGAQARAGGLAGSGHSIFYSHATGNVSAGPQSEGGGLAGYVGGFTGNDGVVRQSWASGNVGVERPRKRAALGGFVGGLGQYAQIDDTYALGYVSGGGVSDLGGYAGWSQGEQLHTSYSAGEVRYGFAADGAPPPNQPRVAGFIGKYDGGHVETNYWDTDTSGQTHACEKKCAGVQGLTGAQLKSALPSGFDSTIWGRDPAINNGYPYLLANPPADLPE